MKLTHLQAVYLTATSWFLGGCMLFLKGWKHLSEVRGILQSGADSFSLPLIHFFKSITNGVHEALSLFLLLSLFIGYLKGQFALRKSAHKVVKHIFSSPSPISIYTLYSKGYMGLIAGMIGMGILFKFLPLPPDIKGFVDWSISAALLYGATFYIKGTRSYSVT